MKPSRAEEWLRRIRSGLKTTQWQYEVFYEDPSSTETHRLRRHLLLLSLVAFIVGPGGVLPTSISAFGIETKELNGKVLLATILGMLAYCLVSFSLHSILSLHAWKRRALSHVVAAAKANQPIGNTDLFYAQNTGAALSKEFFWQPVVRLWMLLEYLLPAGIAITAIASLTVILIRS